MPAKPAPLGALLTSYNILINLNRDYFVYLCRCLSFKIYTSMDLKAKIKVVKFLLLGLGDSIESSMKSVESADLFDDSELFGDYNTLGYVLAAVRDILKELDKDGK